MACTDCCWPGCSKNPRDDIPLCAAHIEITVKYADRPNLPMRHTFTEPPPKKPRTSHVYYLLVGDVIKIGYSSRMSERLRQYPPHSELLALEPGGKEIEARRHKQFEEHLHAGREWFLDHPEIREHIANVVTDHGAPYVFGAPKRRKVHPVRKSSV